MDWGIIITLGVTIVGWATTLGICKQKIENNERDIQEIKSRQCQTDTILQSINTTLASLDAKVDLLIRGKINTQG